MTIDNELIDSLLKDYKKPEDIIGENGLAKGGERISLLD
jgi:putative transposase